MLSGLGGMCDEDGRTVRGATPRLPWGAAPGAAVTAPTTLNAREIAQRLWRHAMGRGVWRVAALSVAPTSGPVRARVAQEPKTSDPTLKGSAPRPNGAARPPPEESGGIGGERCIGRNISRHAVCQGGSSMLTTPDHSTDGPLAPATQIFCLGQSQRGVPPERVDVGHELGALGQAFDRGTQGITNGSGPLRWPGCRVRTRLRSTGPSGWRRLDALELDRSTVEQVRQDDEAPAHHHSALEIVTIRRPSFAARIPAERRSRAILAQLGRSSGAV